MRKCKGCSKDISHRHKNCKFHSQLCKDTFHNKMNPRGYSLLVRPTRHEQDDETFSATGADLDYDDGWCESGGITEHDDSGNIIGYA